MCSGYEATSPDYRIEEEAKRLIVDELRRKEAASLKKREDAEAQRLADEKFWAHQEEEKLAAQLEAVCNAGNIQRSGLMLNCACRAGRKMGGN